MPMPPATHNTQQGGAGSPMDLPQQQTQPIRSTNIAIPIPPATHIDSIP
jgi:hypothetical protein